MSHKKGGSVYNIFIHVLWGCVVLPTESKNAYFQECICIFPGSTVDQSGALAEDSFLHGFMLNCPTEEATMGRLN